MHPDIAKTLDRLAGVAERQDQIFDAKEYAAQAAQARYRLDPAALTLFMLATVYGCLAALAGWVVFRFSAGATRVVSPWQRLCGWGLLSAAAAGLLHLWGGKAVAGWLANWLYAVFNWAGYWVYPWS